MGTSRLNSGGVVEDGFHGKSYPFVRSSRLVVGVIAFDLCLYVKLVQVFDQLLLCFS